MLYPIRCPRSTHADECGAELSLDHQTATPQVPNHADVSREPTIPNKDGAAKGAQSVSHRAMGGPDSKRATETAFGQLKTSLRLQLLTTPASCTLLASAPEGELSGRWISSFVSPLGPAGVV